MFTTYSNYKPTKQQLENMKLLAKATANKKLYIEYRAKFEEYHNK